jgi:hypothetical protein
MYIVFLKLIDGIQLCKQSYEILEIQCTCNNQNIISMTNIQEHFFQ